MTYAFIIWLISKYVLSLNTFQNTHITYAIRTTHTNPSLFITAFTRPRHLPLATSRFTRIQQTICEDRIKRMGNISDGTRASCHPDALRPFTTNDTPALKPFYSREPLKDRKLVSWDNKICYTSLFCVPPYHAQIFSHVIHQVSGL